MNTDKTAAVDAQKDAPATTENKAAETKAPETKKPETPAKPKAEPVKPVETSANVNPKKKKNSKQRREEKAVAEAAKKKLDETNAAAAAKKITAQKDLKYKYPADVDDLDKRKTFRATVRRTLKSFEKELARLKRTNLPEDLKLMGKKEVEFAKYKKQVLAHV